MFADDPRDHGWHQEEHPFREALYANADADAGGKQGAGQRLPEEHGGIGGWQDKPECAEDRRTNCGPE